MLDNSIYPAASRDSFDAVAMIRRRRRQHFKPDCQPASKPVSQANSQPQLSTFNKVFAIIPARYRQLNIDSTAQYTTNDRLNFAR